LEFRITISDGELSKNKLELLTRESYDTVRIKLIKRLRIIRETLRKLEICTINYHKLDQRLTRRQKISRYLRQKFGLADNRLIHTEGDPPLEDPSEEEIETYEIESAHIRAKAHYQYRLKTRTGKAHLRRAQYELWARKKYHFLDFDASPSSKSRPTHDPAYLLPYVEYLMDIFTISEDHPNEIHHRDLDLLFQYYLYLDLPSTTPSTSSTPTDYQKILQFLDPHNTGYIRQEPLVNWLLSGQHLPYEQKPFKKILHQGLGKWIPILDTSSTKDATLKILCDMRRITRHEILSQKQALVVIDTLLEAEEKKSTLLLTNQQKKQFQNKMKELQEESELANEKLKQLKLLFNKEEQRVLSRIAEDDAEKLIQQKIYFTSQGRYFLRMEILLMRVAQEMMITVGTIIPLRSQLPNMSSSSAWKTNPTSAPHGHERRGATAAVSGTETKVALTKCLNILINCFDTDCSGTFDESEITLLLKCVKCSLPEKWILFHFPDVVLDSSSLSQVNTHLLTRVQWKRTIFAQDLHISTKSFVSSSSLLLISAARQLARDKAHQAAELVNTGILLDDDDGGGVGGDGSHGDDSVTLTLIPTQISEGLLTRCQLLAMRQTSEFLETPFGHIRKLAIQEELGELWDQATREQFSKLSLIRYLFCIHQIDNLSPPPLPPSSQDDNDLPRPQVTQSSNSHRVLNSELPHLIRYAVTRFNWSLKQDMSTCQALAILFKFTQETDARWIFFDEVIEILERSFDMSTQQLPARSLFTRNGTTNALLNDAKKRMDSLARQQAILIAINYPDKDVKETNYRCFILGIYRCLELFKSSSPNTSPKQGRVDWENVPFETILIYLLGQGFTYQDLVMKPYLYQSDDHIDYDNTVDPQQILSQAMSEIFSNLNCSSSLYRMIRFLGGMKSFHFYSELVQLFHSHRQEINIFGRMFLNEIMTGISHCSFDEAS
jgi:hypothetical protein